MFFLIKFIIYKRFFWKKFHSKNRKMEYQMIFFQRKKIMMIFNIWSAGQFSHKIIESKFIFDHFTIINNNVLHHNNFAFWLCVCGNQKTTKFLPCSSFKLEETKWKTKPQIEILVRGYILLLLLLLLTSLKRLSMWSFNLHLCCCCC